ncbi:tRNA (adenosine(37)-N6)-dimethylallyltransferase MiaA [Dermatophilaceae bacterium Soc4.6]
MPFTPLPLDPLEPAEGRDQVELVVIAVVGPTATGKSDLALDLAERLGGEVVGADAMQLYRGMDIGTAKLTTAERRGIPHHQLDVLDARDEASVAAYQREARADVAAISGRGRRPVLVGGSGLYVRAALDTLEIPPTDPAVRARLSDELERDGTASLRDRLVRLDPVAAQAIDPSNGRRLVRALEVIELTGRPFSATLPSRELARPTVILGLHAERATLDARIEARVERMWDAGLLDEVESLLGQGLREGRTASRAIGYAQAVGQLDGVLTGAQARAGTAAGTRRLARRQQSWFTPDPRVVWLPHDAPDLLDRALAEVTAADTGVRAANP